ncbi:hypothetical protein PGT21_020350 [Puccinia graminis f. sp. tritici]|uniref:Uncharacterized protein n=1 Tax=Puccinia graminis f. sp. tritici TaxID=56615 RepID=A0A5B0LZH7_PUCGR|nr:hypothetical protein PGT21_020350 [Puccinia graminis f. sp. tritici]
MIGEIVLKLSDQKLNLEGYMVLQARLGTHQILVNKRPSALGQSQSPLGRSQSVRGRSQSVRGTIPTPAWHMLKLAGVGTKPCLAKIKRGCHARQHTGPREGHLLSRDPVPGWCTGYQSAQGLKSAQRDLAMCQVLPPTHPVQSSPLGTI